jgi:hypothetical protein
MGGLTDSPVSKVGQDGFAEGARALLRDTTALSVPGGQTLETCDATDSHQLPRLAARGRRPRRGSVWRTIRPVRRSGTS